MSKAEKFISDCTRNCSNQSEWGVETPNKSIVYVQPWLTPDQARKAVEIAREEICEWLINHNDYIITNGNITYFDMEKCVKDLKQATIMSKAEERALERFPVHEGASKEWIEMHLKGFCAEYIDGYHQAEKDLLENKHETSWRLDEKLWKGIKDIGEASYQYMYDASNDWAYDIPTWKDVQDAFKAGSEWKEGLELTWENMFTIYHLVNEVIDDYADGKTKKEVGEEVLKRFNEERKEK